MYKFKPFTRSKNDYFFNSRAFINNAYSEITNTLKRLNGNLVESQNLRNTTEINVFETFKHLVDFQSEFKDLFYKYLDERDLNKLYQNEIDTLTTLIIIWKQFIYSKYRYQPKILKIAVNQFKKTKIEIKLKLYKECINHFKKQDFFEKLVEDKDSKRLVFILNVTRDNFVDILSECFSIVSNVFGNMHHSSLKSLLVNFNYEKVTFVPLIGGKPLNDKFLELPIWRINIINQKISEGREITNVFEIFDFPEEYDKKFMEENMIYPWNKIIPEIKLYEEIIGLISSLKYLGSHIIQLKNNFKEIDSLGKKVLDDYLRKITDFIDANIISKSVVKIKEIMILLDRREKFESLTLMKDLVSAASKYITIFESINKPQLLFTKEIEDIFLQAGEFEEGYEIFAEALIFNYLENSKDI